MIESKINFDSVLVEIGEVAERFKAPVLKTGVGKLTVSSNLTLSESLVKGFSL